MLIYLPDKTKTLLEQHLSHNRCSVTKEQMFVWMNGHCEKFEVYFSVFCIKQNGSPSNGADAALGYIKLHRFITALLWGGAKLSCRRQWAHGLLNFAQGTQVIQAAQNPVWKRGVEKMAIRQDTAFLLQVYKAQTSENAFENFKKCMWKMLWH